MFNQVISLYQLKNLIFLNGNYALGTTYINGNSYVSVNDNSTEIYRISLGNNGGYLGSQSSAIVNMGVPVPVTEVIGSFPNISSVNQLVGCPIEYLFDNSLLKGCLEDVENDAFFIVYNSILCKIYRDSQSLINIDACLTDNGTNECVSCTISSNVISQVGSSLPEGLDDLQDTLGQWGFEVIVDTAYYSEIASPLFAYEL